MTPTPARRLFVLLVWSPQLGMPADPVGVLGVEQDGARWRSYVSWVPHHDGRALPWRQRLRTADPLTPDLVEHWMDQDGTTHLIEEEGQVPEAPSLAHLVEGHLDLVLVDLAVGEGR